MVYGRVLLDPTVARGEGSGPETNADESSATGAMA